MKTDSLETMSDEQKRGPGRPTNEPDAAEGHIHVRTTLHRKSHYVKAAKPKKLTEWMLETLDKASDYTPPDKPTTEGQQEGSK